MDTGKMTLRTSLVALFAALTAAGTFIALPIPGSAVPVVLQNLFALLSGLVLGPVMGFAAIAVYLLVGGIGLPVFAGGKGGAAHFFGPTGGYLLGYALCALVAGLIAGKPRADKQSPIWIISIAAVLGIVAVYVPGVLRLKAVLKAEWPKALAVGMFPFIVGDVVKIAIAIGVAGRLRRVVADKLDA
ncbi:MAG: biotin transporter BioY [Treponemataceae bacterium]